MIGVFDQKTQNQQNVKFINFKTCPIYTILKNLSLFWTFFTIFLIFFQKMFFEIFQGGLSLGEIHPSEPLFQKYKMHELHPSHKQYILRFRKT